MPPIGINLMAYRQCAKSSISGAGVLGGQASNQ
jgi:hypothetical protein